MQQDRHDNYKRILAIGDVHGCFTALKALFEIVNPGTDDLVITLGDYIDRGPESKEVIDLLVRLHEAQPVVSLKGNHEEMVLDWRNENYEKTLIWWANGGLATLRSYCRDDSSWLTKMFWKSFIPGQVYDYHDRACKLIPGPHWSFFENCRDYYETRDCIFVHGQVDPHLALTDQSEYKMHWSRFHTSQKSHLSGKKVICGHTPQADGIPTDIGHTVCIDTYLYGGQWLTCMDVRNKIYFQANALGETRILDESGEKIAAKIQ